MYVTNRTVLGALSLIAVAACAPSSPTAADPEAEKAAIHARDQAHVDAYNAGDVEAIVAGYADDAVLMPSGGPSLVGRDAIRKYFTESIASAKVANLTESLGEYSSGVSGDLGWTAGMSKETSATGTTVWAGKYLAVWRKTDGKWLTIRDTWNDDTTPAVQESDKHTK